MNDDSCDLETARLLLDAIRNEPFCDDPTCCPPEEDQPVLTNPYTIIKTTAAVLIALFLTLFVIVMVLG